MNIIVLDNRVIPYKDILYRKSGRAPWHILESPGCVSHARHIILLIYNVTQTNRYQQQTKHAEKNDAILKIINKEQCIKPICKLEK